MVTRIESKRKIGFRNAMARTLVLASDYSKWFCRQQRKHALASCYYGDEDGTLKQQPQHY